jgi:hypothetical protein
MLPPLWNLLALPVVLAMCLRWASQPRMNDLEEDFANLIAGSRRNIYSRAYSNALHSLP